MGNSFGLSWGLTIIWQSFCPCIPNCKALRRAVEQQQPPALREALAEALSINFPWHFGTFRLVSPPMWLLASCGARCHADAYYGKGCGQILLGPNDQTVTNQHLSLQAVAAGSGWELIEQGPESTFSRVRWEILRWVISAISYHVRSSLQPWPLWLILGLEVGSRQVPGTGARGVTDLELIAMNKGNGSWYSQRYMDTSPWKKAYNTYFYYRFAYVYI